MGRLMRWLGISIVLVFIVIAGAASWGYAEFVRSGPLVATKVLVIPKGVGIERIAILLARHGIIKVPLVLSLAARTIGREKALQAGEFSFPQNISTRGVLEILQSGKQVVRRLTIPEGLTRSEVLSILTKTEGLKGPISVQAKEGELLPETYHFSYGDSRNAIIMRMQDGMNKALQALWPQRAPNLPLNNIEEVLILASIVEKETGQAAERARVAGVFINRLRRKMRLQSDPTVTYGLTNGQGDLGRSLTRRDLRTPSPYNTYLNHGLPPGPIANPGRAALEAVLHPVKTDELYFVADGSGGHAFARTLAEHNANVAKWRKIQQGK